MKQLFVSLGVDGKTTESSFNSVVVSQNNADRFNYSKLDNKLQDISKLRDEIFTGSQTVKNAKNEIRSLYNAIYNKRKR